MQRCRHWLSRRWNRQRTAAWCIGSRPAASCQQQRTLRGTVYLPGGSKDAAVSTNSGMIHYITTNSILPTAENATRHGVLTWRTQRCRHWLSRRWNRQRTAAWSSASRPAAGYQKSRTQEGKKQSILSKIEIKNISINVFSNNSFSKIRSINIRQGKFIPLSLNQTWFPLVGAKNSHSWFQ